MKGYEWRDAILSDACHLDHLTMLVLLFIAKHMNGSKDMAWPTQKTIAKNLHVSVRTAQRHLNRAEAAGWVKIKRQRFGSRYSNEYTASLGDTVVSRYKAVSCDKGEGDKPDQLRDTMDVVPIPISNPNQESSKRVPNETLGEKGLPSASKEAAPPAPRPEKSGRKKTPAALLTPEQQQYLERLNQIKQHHGWQ
jgi:DNA-binding transcriptional MocR family regulator